MEGTPKYPGFHAVKVIGWDVRDGKSIGHIFGPNLSGDSLDYKYWIFSFWGMAKY